MAIRLWDPSPSRTRNSARLLSKSSEQWKLSLQEVKLLHLKRRHRQCAASSVEMLRKHTDQLHNIHRAYLHYYCAASYEALGRAAHNFSSNKIPMLRLAKDNYDTCKVFLETAFIGSQQEGNESDIAFADRGIEDLPPTSVYWKSARNKDNHSSWNDYIRAYTGSNNMAPTFKTAGYTKTLDRSKSCSANSARQREGIKTDLVPPPLYIRKSRRDGSRVQNYDESSKHRSAIPLHRPLPEPPSSLSFRPAFNPDTPPYTPRSSFTKSIKNHSVITDTSTPTSRILNLITSLTTQIDNNITSISTLITETTNLQRIHKANKSNRLASFWSFTPTYTTDPGPNPNPNKPNGTGKRCSIEPTINNSTSISTSTSTSTSSSNDETKQQRIARLRSEGWNTVGIRSPDRGWKGSQHYERVCSMALAELYGM